MKAAPSKNLAGSNNRKNMSMTPLAAYCYARIYSLCLNVYRIFSIKKTLLKNLCTLLKRLVLRTSQMHSMYKWAQSQAIPFPLKKTEQPTRSHQNIGLVLINRKSHLRFWINLWSSRLRVKHKTTDQVASAHGSPDTRIPIWEHPGSSPESNPPGAVMLCSSCPSF